MTTWTTSSLERVGRWLSGGTPSKQNPALWDGDVPWVSPKDMKRPRISDAIDHVSEAAVGNGTQFAPVGSLLMVVRGMILAHTFPVALTTAPVTFNQDVKALVPEPDWAPEFLLYWLQNAAADVLRIVDVANHGTKRIPSERLFEMPVPQPPLAEQRKIAAILSAADEAIEASRAVIDQLQVVKRAMMAELLTRGMPDRHQRFQETEIGTFPAAWQLESVRDVGEVMLGRMRSPIYNTGRNRPYLRVANVQDGEIDTTDVLEMPFEDRDFERFRLRAGDILLNEGQDLELVGRPAMYMGSPPDCAFQKTLLRFRAGPRVDADYALAMFQFWLYTGRFSEHAVQTTSIAHLTLARFAAMKTPVPSLTEQKEIATAINKVSTRIDAEKATLRAHRSLKASLASALLTGELRVERMQEQASQ